MNKGYKAKKRGNDKAKKKRMRKTMKSTNKRK